MGTRSSTAAELRARLRHVWWIGGGSGAGKTTIARNLAARYGLQVYSTDDAMRDHAARSTPEDAPALSSFLAMDMDERWVNRPPKTMLETFHWFRGEGFDFIAEDLLGLSTETGVIAEGFRLLPRLVEPLLTTVDHSVWLLPTPEFRRASFDRRGWEIPSRTGNPERAARNLLERDRMFTDRLRKDTARLQLPAIEVGTAMSEDDLTDMVGRLFRL
ncbi:AAA family ATPase [Nocardia vinacea]|uniref:AAA family ATPase n=1 Tax=Nocardia vinacea TaxID=96468 RepID=UPI002E14E19B|nr:AAA family ATPase [Nocardia vinacea]